MMPLNSADFDTECFVMIESGTRISLTYPDTDLVESIAKLQRRQIQVHQIRDLVADPLTPEEYLRRPYTRRSRWLIRGLDETRNEWWQFYLGSSAEYESPGVLRVALYEPGGKVVESTGWVYAGEMSSESVEEYAASLRKAGRSAQTIAHHLQSVKQLARWLSRTNRLHHHPLETVNKPNPKSDRRRERRMLLPDEWPHLKRHSKDDHALVYELAIQTGLRSGELRSLTASNLHASGKQPYVAVPGRETKDSNLARQYITKSLSSKIKRRKRHRSLFDLPNKFSMADMLRDDMATARQSWVDSGGDKKSDFLQPINDAGERLDFHSLRHTCGAWLALKSVHPKTIQTIMRHSSITLTMDMYGHLFPNAETEAVMHLGSLLDGQ